jgi:hypothetical protein
MGRYVCLKESDVVIRDGDESSSEDDSDDSDDDDEEDEDDDEGEENPGEGDQDTQIDDRAEDVDLDKEDDAEVRERTQAEKVGIRYATWSLTESRGTGDPPFASDDIHGCIQGHNTVC